MVSVPESRSKGYGKKIIVYLEQYAKENGCKLIALSSGIKRTEAHRFYEQKCNFDKELFVYTKSLENKP
jgi:GNAT superfamily N-acetyltransferase